MIKFKIIYLTATAFLAAFLLSACSNQNTPGFSGLAGAADSVRIEVGRPLTDVRTLTLSREVDAKQMDRLAEAAERAVLTCAPLTDYSPEAGSWGWVVTYYCGETPQFSVSLSICSRGWVILCGSCQQDLQYYYYNIPQNPPEEIVEFARILHTLVPAEDEYWIGEVLGLDP